MQKFLVMTAASSAALSAIGSGALADDLRLDAALKRIEALEAKMTRLSEVEAENGRLKARVKKLEAGNGGRAPAATIADRTPSLRPMINRDVETVAATNNFGPTQSSPKNWSGVYVGINAGYGTGEVGSSSVTVDAGPITLNGTGPLIGVFSNSFMLNGPAAGGQLGYNYELSNKLIVGVETDFDYTDFNNKLGAGNGNTNYRQIIIGSGFNQSQYKNDRIGVDWLGTTKIRLGYDLGSFMPYIMGGLAYGAISSDLMIANNYSVSSSGCSGCTSIIQQYGQENSRNSSSVQVGWTTGAGGELKVSERWSIRGEYVYTQLGSINTESTSSSFLNFTQLNSASGFGLQQSNIGPFGIHQARFGLNYHTGWFSELTSAPR